MVAMEAIPMDQTVVTLGDGHVRLHRDSQVRVRHFLVALMAVEAEAVGQEVLDRKVHEDRCRQSTWRK